jgi:hypothetical protein
VEVLSGASFYGRHVALPINIRPGWKGLLLTHALRSLRDLYITNDGTKYAIPFAPIRPFQSGSINVSGMGGVPV